jgi:hypothetical protein
VKINHVESPMASLESWYVYSPGVVWQTIELGGCSSWLGYIFERSYMYALCASRRVNYGVMSSSYQAVCANLEVFHGTIANRARHGVAQARGQR